MTQTDQSTAGRIGKLIFLQKTKQWTGGLCNRPPLIWRHIQVCIYQTHLAIILTSYQMFWRWTFCFHGELGRRGGGAGVGTAAVYLFYEPTAVAADLTGIVHLFSVVGGRESSNPVKNLIASLTPGPLLFSLNSPASFFLLHLPFWGYMGPLYLSLFMGFISLSLSLCSCPSPANCVIVDEPSRVVCCER
jgi:hypothetical protein